MRNHYSYCLEICYRNLATQFNPVLPRTHDVADPLRVARHPVVVLEPHHVHPRPVRRKPCDFRRPVPSSEGSGQRRRFVRVGMGVAEEGKGAPAAQWKGDAEGVKAGAEALLDDEEDRVDEDEPEEGLPVPPGGEDLAERRVGSCARREGVLASSAC